MDHEFIEVGRRRWCLGCSLFQWKSCDQGAWQPARETGKTCPRDTPYADQRKAATHE